VLFSSLAHATHNAPEVMLGQQTTKASDVFAFGVLSEQLMHRACHVWQSSCGFKWSKQIAKHSPHQHSLHLW
jgi:hypothetical protein